MPLALIILIIKKPFNIILLILYKGTKVPRQLPYNIIYKRLPTRVTSSSKKRGFYLLE